jgi:DNA-binding transcriptional ArsR family regulator
MPLTRRRVTDAAALKALAHPVRIALIDALVAHGPLTASEAAEIIGDSPSNCSWHLRKLAEHGFVREATSTDGRNRPWRVVSEALEWSDDGGDTPQAERVAADAMTDVLLERQLQKLRAARAAQPSEPAEWREATAVMQAQLWLTADEAAGLKSGLEELMTRYVDRLRDPDLRPQEARLVSMVGWLVPSGPHSGRHRATGQPAPAPSAAEQERGAEEGQPR